MPIAKAFDFGTDLYESATNEADANAENTSGDMHAQEADETQPSAESDNIQYPSMLGRMVELESVVATVRSSLDNHTSSYYSVASQIAELNARIGHLGGFEKPIDVGAASSIQTNAGHNRDPATSRTNAAFVTDSSEIQDPSGTVTPITTTTTETATAGAAGVSRNVLMPAEQSDRENSDGYYARIQQMIDSLIKDADSALQSKPASNRFSICSDDSVDIPGKISSFFSEPPSSMSGEFGETPTLVSDAELGSQNSPPFSFTSQHAPCSLSDLEHRLAATASRQRHQPHNRSYSPLPKYRAIVDPTEADAESDSEVSVPSVLGARHRRRNHNSNNHIQRPYSSRLRRRCGGGPNYYGERPSSKASRRRSNTVGSVISNSSETCVSPVSRTSKEFHSTPVPYYIYRHTPAGETFHGFEKDMLGTEQCASSAPATATKNAHEFPRLSVDNGDARRVRTERRLSSPLIRRVPPLINRFRNTVTRAALRSASFVDDSVNDDIAALECGSSSSRGEQQPRTRSNTYGGECSSAMFSHHSVRPNDLACCSLTGVVHHLGGDSDQRKRSGSLIEGNSQVTPTTATNYVASKLQGDSNAAGILSVFSLIYWTLLFTLGALMLDSFLCQVAGKRVMGTVDRIAKTEGADLIHPGRKRSSSRNSMQRGKERADDDGEDTIDATGAVGRLVRWYIEDPDEAPGVRGLRLRKVQTARGLFKLVE